MSIVPQLTLIHNSEPEGKRRSGSFRDSGWLTVDGYWKEADELSRCMWRNREKMLKSGRDYTFFISLNIELALPPKDVSELSAKITRKLRTQGFIGLWVREVSPTDHCNYHIISKSDGDVEAQIRKAIPAGIPYHLHIQKFDRRKAYYGLRYVTKAKTPLYRDGKLISRDRWASKRTFFKADTGLDKWNTIGQFWEKGTTKAKLWQEIKDHEQRIADGLTVDGADELVEYLDELTGRTLDTNKIRRAVGFHAKDYEAEGTIKPPKSVYEYDPPPKPSGSPSAAPRTPPKAKGNRGSVTATQGSRRHPEGLNNLVQCTRFSSFLRHAFFGAYPQYHPP